MKTTALGIKEGKCVFCGGDRLMMYTERGMYQDPNCYVKCWDCGAQGPVKSSSEDAKKAFFINE